MLELPNRDFQINRGRREKVPLWIGLYGPSGGGKTKSALRLADGIRSIQGGPVYGIDTEAKRMLHYADKHDFEHLELKEPFGSLDYLAGIKASLAHNRTGKRPTVIIDSMSHEHEGPGGMLDLQDHIARRMATKDGRFDERKYERIKMLAWAEPKAKRRALINGMLNLEANFILCFRAKESSVPMKKRIEPEGGGRPYEKTEVVHLGFVPIGGDDFIYECTLAALLMPGARGVPTYHSELIGERKMIKLPEQFLQLENIADRPLDEKIGRMLAEWAQGGSAGGDPQPRSEQARDGSGSASGSGSRSARGWVEWLEGELAACKSAGDVEQLRAEVEETLEKLRKASPDYHSRAQRAIDDRLAADFAD